VNSVPAPVERRFRLTLPKAPGPMALLPYLYVAVLAGSLLLVEPALIDGPGAIEFRFAALLPLALVAFGQTLVIFTKGLDLSVGGVMSLASVIVATGGEKTGGGLLLELAAVVALGGAVGLINGALIAYTRMQPFIVTLAAWSILNGVALVILPVEGGVVPPALGTAVEGEIAGIPKSVWGVALLFGLWIWMRRTRLIRDLWAIGGDEGRARLLAVSIERRKLQTYAISGALAALAGIYLTAINYSGSATIGDEFILTSVAAVVIGGTSLFGGSGSAAASIVGALAYLMIPDLIVALQINPFWGPFVQGMVLILAVTVSALTLTRSGRRL
jgi:ribose transport system permease protein